MPLSRLPGDCEGPPKLGPGVVLVGVRIVGVRTVASGNASDWAAGELPERAGEGGALKSFARSAATGLGAGRTNSCGTGRDAAGGGGGELFRCAV